MYQLLTDNHNLADKKLLQDNLLQKVINELLDNDNLLTLKEIKRMFPNVDNMDSQMNQWIKKEVITRKNGKYSVCCPLISLEKWRILTDEVTSLFEEHHDFLTSYFRDASKEFSSEVALTHLLLAFYENSQVKDKPFFCLEVAQCNLLFLELPTLYQKISGKKTQWLSFESARLISLTIPSYFDYLNVPTTPKIKCFKEVQELIGDVNPTYFMTYVERKMRRLNKGRSVSSNKTDIFLEALGLMNYVYIENDTYHSNMPSFNSELYDRCYDWTIELSQKLDLSLPKVLYLGILISYLNKKNMIKETSPTLYLLRYL